MMMMLTSLFSLRNDLIAQALGLSAGLLLWAAGWPAWCFLLLGIGILWQWLAAGYRHIEAYQNLYSRAAAWTGLLCLGAVAVALPTGFWWLLGVPFLWQSFRVARSLWLEFRRPRSFWDL